MLWFSSARRLKAFGTKHFSNSESGCGAVSEKVHKLTLVADHKLPPEGREDAIYESVELTCKGYCPVSVSVGHRISHNALILAELISIRAKW